jgi:hypothetical protein
VLSKLSKNGPKSNTKSGNKKGTEAKPVFNNKNLKNTEDQFNRFQSLPDETVEIVCEL